MRKPGTTNSLFIVLLAVGGCILGCSTTDNQQVQHVRTDGSEPSFSSQATPQPVTKSLGDAIPDLLQGKLMLVDVYGERDLVNPSGQKWGGYFSSKGLVFDEERSLAKFGIQQTRIKHSGDALAFSDPITVRLSADDPLDYVKKSHMVVPPSGTVVWIEASKDGNGVILSTDSSRITPAALRILDFDKKQLPSFKLEFYPTGPGGGAIFLLGDGTEYWGAVEGTINLGGRKVRNLKGARIVDGKPSKRIFGKESARENCDFGMNVKVIASDAVIREVANWERQVTCFTSAWSPVQHTTDLTENDIAISSLLLFQHGTRFLKTIGEKAESCRLVTTGIDKLTIFGLRDSPKLYITYDNFKEEGVKRVKFVRKSTE